MYREYTVTILDDSRPRDKRCNGIAELTDYVHEIAQDLEDGESILIEVNE